MRRTDSRKSHDTPYSEIHIQWRSPPFSAWHRGHLHSTQIKRVWGKSPRRRTGESQVPQHSNRGSNLLLQISSSWTRRSRSNPPARGNICVRIRVNSTEHLTPVARERGKRRTDESAKSDWTKGATHRMLNS